MESSSGTGSSNQSGCVEVEEREMSSLEEGAGTMRPRTKQEVFAKVLRQVGASIFFGVSSVLIITVNKTVLTTYRSVVHAVLINAHCKLHFGGCLV